jgi:hypothetical protein
VEHLEDLVPCAPIPEDLVAQGRCARQFIARFGRRAYRARCRRARRGTFVALYEQERGEVGPRLRGRDPRGDHRRSVMSPHFLYRWDLSPEAPRAP